MNYYHVDRTIAKIERKIHILSALKPVNLRWEQKKFLADPVQSPQFKYRKIRFNPDHLREELEDLKVDRSPLGMIFQEKIQELMLKIELLMAIGTPTFTPLSEKLYGNVDEALLKKAHARVQNSLFQKNNGFCSTSLGLVGSQASAARRKGGECPAEQSFAETELSGETMGFPRNKKKLFSAEEAKNMFEKLFDEYGLHQWQVKLKKSLVSRCICGKRNVLFVRAGARFSRESISRIITHEIETHLFTAENGKLQPYKIFNRGLAGYLETQEGLAVYAQKRKRDMPSFLLPWTALSVLAVSFAKEGSFLEVYKKLRNFDVSEKRAFRLASRVKRGLTDTSLPGVFTKEAIYFTGEEKVELFIKGGGDLKKLFVGKIPIQDLPFITQIPGMLPAKYLPSWLAHVPKSA